MFVFIQFYKSNKQPTYTQNECSDDLDAAKAYAETLLNSSVDVREVELYQVVGSVAKVEVAEWN
jgi:hypothetical protein